MALFFMFAFPQAHAQIEHSLFTELLQKNVSEAGFVDYQNFKKQESELDVYLELLSTNTPDETWSRNQKMAYLINTYNAYTLKLILDNYPVESIKKIGGILGNPFKINFIPFNGHKISLDEVEKGMLLKMNEPRIHFAINCASESCPKLHNQAFEADMLETQLERVTRDFILSKENTIMETKLVLSKIFKWYAFDFEQDAGSVQAFINRYAAFEIKENTPLSYRDYSWKLNGK